MRDRTVTLDKKYEREYLFFLDALKRHGITHAESHTDGRFRVFTAETGSQTDVVNAHLAEVLLTPFKSRYFMENAIVPRFLEEYALLFVSLDFAGIRERLRLIDVLDGINELHIDALYNFKMSAFKDEWQGILRLICDLYDLPPLKSEIIDLTRHVMRSERQRPESKLRYFIFDDPCVCALQRALYYHERIKDFPKGTEKARNLLKKLL